jgi:segregation and condensation protein A
MSAERVARPYVQIEPYEGPLDLLLYLVRRDGIDIRTLPIAHITREYLAALGEIREEDLDRAGDFLVMAATLCELKSRELLPVLERSLDAVEEAEDPREALIFRLLEHQRYFEVAQALSDRLWLGRDVFARTVEVSASDDRRVEAGLDAFGLLELLESVGLRRKRREPVVHKVAIETESLRDCAERVVARLDDGTEHRFESLIIGMPRASSRVMTFLAVLELARLRIVSLSQRAHLFPVFLRARSPGVSERLTGISEAS